MTDQTATNRTGQQTGQTRPRKKRAKSSYDVAKERIAELEAQLAAAQARETVMLSARIPRHLRDQIRDASGGRSLQDVVTEALEAWLEANRN